MTGTPDPGAAPDDPVPQDSRDPFEAILAHVKEARGFDLTGYKRSGLTRRVARRMEQVGLTDHAEYLDRLELDADEYTSLFDTVLINVTAFFRDAEAWEYLRTEVLPPLVAAGPPGRPIRVWSAGCASGEEAYTLAIVLCELLGVEEFRNRVKIYATDVDADGLATARQAVYGAREIQAVPPDLRIRYFEENGGRWVFRPDLRRSVIFGRNDLVQDAPISRIDLLVCRNTLMYFTAETQARILARFHFSLAPTGVLFLGTAEMLLSHAAIFRPVDVHRRVFRALPAPAPRDEPAGLDELRHESLLTSPLAHVVVTTDGHVAMINRRAEVLFGASSRDVGRPFVDLELSYRPVELRQIIDQAQLDRRPMRVSDVRAAGGGRPGTHLDIEVTPLVAADSRLLGVSVVFDDVSRSHRLQEELEQANRQLETAYEELRSANEELETTNEELQSTVEELETMNEELRSTNDELQLLNGRLQVRSGELDTATEFLDTVLAGLRAAVVVLSPDLTVQVWNRQAQELWGLRRDETVGTHFLTLDIGLPLDDLRPMIRRTLSGEPGPHEMAVPAVNRRGRPISVRIVGRPLHPRGAAGPGGTGGIILLMDHDETDAGRRS